jgi:hypothetical protein
MEKSKTGKKKGQSSFNSATFEVEADLKNVIEFEKVNIIFQKRIEIASMQT